MTLSAIVAVAAVLLVLLHFSLVYFVNLPPSSSIYLSSFVSVCLSVLLLYLHSSLSISLSSVDLGDSLFNTINGSSFKWWLELNWLLPTFYLGTSLFYHHDSLPKCLFLILNVLSIPLTLLHSAKVFFLLALVLRYQSQQLAIPMTYGYISFYPWPMVTFHFTYNLRLHFILPIPYGYISFYLWPMVTFHST